MSNYGRGRRLEYQAKQWLIDSGYLVFRCAGSKPIDLIAMKDRRILFVECKYGKKPKVDMGEIERWESVSKQFGAKYVVCRKEREGPMEFLSMQFGGLKEVISL